MFPGRIPELAVQSEEIDTYAQNVMQGPESKEVLTLQEEHSLCLSAVITGKIDQLPNKCNRFRAYSYMSERFVTGLGSTSLACPPFMIAQTYVLGKDYKPLQKTLENTFIDEAKAFEALIQLAVLVRLIAKEDHKLVPCHPRIKDVVAVQ